MLKKEEVDKFKNVVNRPGTMGYYRLLNEDLERIKELNSSAISILIYLELKKILSMKKDNKDFVDISDKNFMSLLGDVSRTGFKAARNNLIEKNVINMESVGGYVKRYTVIPWKDPNKISKIRKRMSDRFKTVNKRARNTRNLVDFEKSQL